MSAASLSGTLERSSSLLKPGMNASVLKVARPETGDLRQRRSRELLRGALLALLQKMPLERITPRDLTATARVGYATFYRHYATREELLIDLARDQVHQLMSLAQPLTDSANTAGACRALCAFVDQNRMLWTTLLSGSAEIHIRKEFLRTAREIAPTFSRPKSPIPAELAMVLAVGSVVEFLAWWLGQMKPISAAKAADLLNLVVIAPTVGRARKKR